MLLNLIAHTCLLFDRHTIWEWNRLINSRHSFFVAQFLIFCFVLFCFKWSEAEQCHWICDIKWNVWIAIHFVSIDLIRRDSFHSLDSWICAFGHQQFCDKTFQSYATFRSSIYYINWEWCVWVCVIAYSWYMNKKKKIIKKRKRKKIGRKTKHTIFFSQTVVWYLWIGIKIDLNWHFDNEYRCNLLVIEQMDGLLKKWLKRAEKTNFCLLIPHLSLNWKKETVFVKRRKWICIDVALCWLCVCVRVHSTTCKKFHEKRRIWLKYVEHESFHSSIAKKNRTKATKPENHEENDAVLDVRPFQADWRVRL